MANQIISPTACVIVAIPCVCACVRACVIPDCGWSDEQVLLYMHIRMLTVALFVTIDEAVHCFLDCLVLKVKNAIKFDWKNTENT